MTAPGKGERQMLDDGRVRQRGTYLHEWTCECGHRCSSGREPKSLGKVVATWCYGCRKMKRVLVPSELGGYIPTRQTVERDHVSALRAALAARDEEIADLKVNGGIRADNLLDMIAEIAALKAKLEAAQAELMKFRVMLGNSRDHGSLFYRDDGELQDNSANPAIDYIRDSADEIAAKWLRRYRDAHEAGKEKP